jgi:hypothetical protein
MTGTPSRLHFDDTDAHQLIATTDLIAAEHSNAGDVLRDSTTRPMGTMPESLQ